VKPKQRHIECFLEIVRQGTIAGAAEQLSVTQPAISRTLADLETILETRLMERSRSGISLTPSGETFLRYASASASALDQGVQQVARGRRGSRQSVNVGVLPNVAARVLPEAVEIFKTEHPQILVRVDTGTNRALTQSLREGDLDFVVGRLAAPADMSDLNFEPLFQEDLVAVVRSGHDFERYAELTLTTSQLQKYCVLLPAPGTIIREDAEQLLISLGVSDPENVIETLSVEFGRSFTLKTDAIWITPRGTVSLEIRSGDLVELAINTAATRGAVGISTRQNLSLSPYARRLAAAIRGVSHKA
jgi:LysR family pca operon transcriptional activator